MLGIPFSARITVIDAEVLGIVWADILVACGGRVWRGATVTICLESQAVIKVISAERFPVIRCCRTSRTKSNSDWLCIASKANRKSWWWLASRTSLCIPPVQCDGASSRKQRNRSSWWWQSTRTSNNLVYWWLTWNV